MTKYSLPSAGRYNVDSEAMSSPASYLVLVWQHAAKLDNTLLENTSVAFRNINFKKTTFMNEKKQLQVTILPGSGNFEVSCNGKVVIDGNVKIINDAKAERVTFSTTSIEKQTLNNEDIYKELTSRGYNFNNSLKCIQSSDVHAVVGYIKWSDWASFVNAMLEFDVFGKNTRDVYELNSIDTIIIETGAHMTEALSEKNILIFRYKDIGTLVAGGIEISGIKWTLKPYELVDRVFEIYGLINDKRKKVNENQKQLGNVHLESSPSGSLSSLRWVESPLLEPSLDSELCHVYFASLNSQDLVYASGRQLPEDWLGGLKDGSLGIEFSGLTTTGGRVMGIAERCLATTVLADKRFLWEVPPNWSLEAAATVPVAFCTAYYALFVRGHIQPNQTVVVYHGCTDIGLAAMALALHQGCKVYSTYGTRVLSQFIASMFLEIPDRNLGYHWDPTFEKKILERTNYKGADIILNLLGPAKIPGALSCLAEGGTLLHLRPDVENNIEIANLSALAPNKTFHTINMGSITESERLTVADLLRQGIRNDDVYPMFSECYSTDVERVQEAFEAAESSDRKGKVIIQIRREEISEEKICKMSILASPRVYMDPNLSYVLVGTFSDFTVNLGYWLISRGAKKLVLIQNSHRVSGYSTRCIERWREQEINVIVINDSSTFGAKNLLEGTARIEPIGGVFDLSAVFQENDSCDDLKKIEGIKILDQATREGAPNLKHFVIFSTASSDERLTDSLLDIVQARKEKKLPSVVVHLGPTDDSTQKMNADKITAFDSTILKLLIRKLDTLLIQPYCKISCVIKQ